MPRCYIVRHEYLSSGHTPEKTVYYQTVARSWPGVVRDFNVANEKISGHVLSEFDRYFKSGILQRGFVRLKCNGCDEERICAYSCKTRGLCFSCNARRMEQTALWIDEEVWPNAAARQWVLSFPFQVRYGLARNPELLSAVNKEVCKEISIFYEDCVAAQLRVAGQTEIIYAPTGIELWYVGVLRLQT